MKNTLKAGEKPDIFLCQNHKKDRAVTIKEVCSIRWNIAWICRDHGRLDFKVNGARNTNRYLIGEIAVAGGNVITHPDYYVSRGGKTHCHAGTGYQGGIEFRTVEAAVRYLKQYFNVIACSENVTNTQVWVDAL